MIDNKLVNQGGAIQPAVSQIVKGLSCLSVMMHHYSQRIITMSPEDSNIVLKLFSAYGGYIAVAIFFFLSGYGLMESETKNHLNVFQFCKKRFWKIYKPLLIINAIALPIYISLNLMEYEGFSSSILYLLNIKLIDNVLWFIQSLLLLYTIFGLCCTLEKLAIKVVAMIIAIAVIMTIGLMFDMLHAYRYISLPFYAFGVVYSLYKENVATIISRRRFIIIPIILLVAIVLTRGISQTIAINSIAVLLLIACNILFVKKELKYNSLIGRISYEIYLVHNKILVLFICLCGYVPNLLLFVAVSMLVAYIISRISNYKVLKSN